MYYNENDLKQDCFWYLLLIIFGQWVTVTIENKSLDKGVGGLLLLQSNGYNERYLGPWDNF